MSLDSHMKLFVTNAPLNILNDMKPLVLYSAIRLSSWDTTTSSHYRLHQNSRVSIHGSAIHRKPTLDLTIYLLHLKRKPTQSSIRKSCDKNLFNRFSLSMEILLGSKISSLWLAHQLKKISIFLPFGVDSQLNVFLNACYSIVTCK